MSLTAINVDHAVTAAAVMCMMLAAAYMHMHCLPVHREVPYAIFGHSMGAWVAFELAQVLDCFSL